MLLSLLIPHASQNRNTSQRCIAFWSIVVPVIDKTGVLCNECNSVWSISVNTGLWVKHLALLLTEMYWRNLIKSYSNGMRFIIDPRISCNWDCFQTADVIQSYIKLMLNRVGMLETITHKFYTTFANTHIQICIQYKLCKAQFKDDAVWRSSIHFSKGCNTLHFEKFYLKERNTKYTKDASGMLHNNLIVNSGTIHPPAEQMIWLDFGATLLHKTVSLIRKNKTSFDC